MNGDGTAVEGLAGVSFGVADLVSLRQAAKRLRLAGRVTPVSWRAGMHVSRIRGRGMSFAESRPYQAGDDVRMIDWRVTARSGRPHTKVFEEERERPVIVIANFAPSMYFGTRVAFKHVIAAELAALVGWAAVAKGDRIGALLACGQAHLELRPAAGRRALMRLFHGLASLSAAPSAGFSAADLDETLQRALRVARPGSLVFLVGDFYDFDARAAEHVSRLGRHNDVVLCQVLDRLEVHPPAAGTYPVSDGHDVRLLHVAAAGRPGCVAEYTERVVGPLRALARRCGFPHGVVCAGTPVAAQLDRILAEGRSRAAASGR